MDLPGLELVVGVGFAWAYEIRKFVNYSITKYNHLTNNQQKHTLDQYQIKLGKTFAKNTL